MTETVKRRRRPAAMLEIGYWGELDEAFHKAGIDIDEPVRDDAICLWPILLAMVKEFGRAGQWQADHAWRIKNSTRLRWNEEHIKRALTLLAQSGRIIIDGEVLTVKNWKDYQVDPTVNERMQKSRAQKKEDTEGNAKLPDVTDGYSNSRNRAIVTTEQNRTEAKRKEQKLTETITAQAPVGDGLRDCVLISGGLITETIKDLVDWQAKKKKMYPLLQSIWPGHGKYYRAFLLHIWSEFSTGKIRSIGGFMKWKIENMDAAQLAIYETADPPAFEWLPKMETLYDKEHRKNDPVRRQITDPAILAAVKTMSMQTALNMEVKK